MGMVVTGDEAVVSAAARPQLKKGVRLGDFILRQLTLVFAFMVVILIGWIGLRLYQQSALTRHTFGWSFLAASTWDVPHRIYGAAPFIFGTFVTATLSLVIAVPFGVGCAVFLSEYAPPRIAAVISFLIELLAAIPSVIFGLWAFLVLCPWMQQNVNPWLAEHFGKIPLFGGPPVMTNMLAAGVILSIMVLPFITAVSKDILKLVPAEQRQASLGLGATKWETIRSVVIPSARSGIVGAIMLALGRAIGETMAVVMVIGNDPRIGASLLKPGYSMPALLANQFNEAFGDDLQLSALLEIALILFVITLVINALARLLIILMSRNQGGGSGKTIISDRAVGLIGTAFKFVIIAVIAGCLVLQVANDIQSHGLRGLLGPIELIVLGFAGVKGLTAATRGTPNWRRWRSVNSITMRSILGLMAFGACVVLAFVLVYVSTRGVKELHLSLFTQLPYPPGEPGGGIKNAIVGTLILISIASVIGIPIGLLGGVYLSEFGGTRVGGVIRFSADVLNGIPSVVIGMFAYAAFVLPFKHFSAAAGGAALGIMMIPTIMRTTEEMLKLVPKGFREASLGLGATHLRTVVSIVIPAARAGVTTGIMLAIARIAGETAPLLFTAFGNDTLSTKLSEPISSMTLKIYQYAISPYNDWIDKAWASALVLLMLVLIISLLARLATRNRYAMR